MVVNDEIRKLVKDAIKEDVGRCDVTTSCIITPGARIKAKIIAEEDLILCGLAVCKEVFRQIDSSVRFKPLKKDGSLVRKGKTIAILEARASSVLTAERLALNFLMHLCGVANAAATAVWVVRATSTNRMVRPMEIQLW